MSDRWVLMPGAKKDPYMRTWASEEIMKGPVRQLREHEINHLHRWGFTTGLGGENLRDLFGHIRFLEGEVARLRRVLPRAEYRDEYGRVIKKPDRKYQCGKCKRASRFEKGTVDAGWGKCDVCGSETWLFGGDK